ncbi:MAG: YkgJ family cysteine cluster protein [Rhodanobacteraceae bacterium]
MTHPCLRCGACCAFFRVAFHWSEAEAFLGGKVPRELTMKLDPHRLAMRGCEGSHPRCIALRGTIGHKASCSIYEERPSVCRQLLPAWEHGVPSPQCDRARQAHGLQPLRPEDWLDPCRPATGPRVRSA